ncbi:uncharacterized protein B0H18DRAFT_841817, partial [Fomitopsis serialis]|uniref:uncharacterized protein n=1 Tax=Fomitopsis serialis TaxID=139415 RepID=UPI00200820A2
LSSKEVVTWLRMEKHLAAFTGKFGLEATVRARHYAVVWQNLSTAFVPSEQAYRLLEKENGWDERDLMVVHWIKPIDKRKLNQQTAYAIAKFSSAKRANDVIVNGLMFFGQRLNAWRLVKEARRCMKCQRLEPGHMASDCTETAKCGTCASPEHTTQKCKVPPGRKRWCVNCEVAGHASWERHCPSFMEANHKIQRANTLEQYRFFPIADDPTSWEPRYVPDQLRFP